MKQTTIENGKVTSTSLGIEDYGILTYWLHISFDGMGCGFGGYCIEGKEPSKYCQESIKRILKVVGVEKWEDLTGKYIRVESEGLGGGIVKIGNIIENKWFDPKELAQELGLMK